MTVRNIRNAATSLALAFIALLMVSLALAQQSESAHQSKLAQPLGKVVEYGIYSEKNDLIKKTTIIPNGAAVRFGFCFEADIQFFDDDRYMMVEALEHPPVKGKEGGENAGYSVPRLFKVREGVAYGCSGYRARDAADLRTGVWRFTISDGPDDVVVQEFTIK